MIVYAVYYQWKSYENYDSSIEYICASREIAEKKIKNLERRDSKFGIKSADNEEDGQYTIIEYEVEGA